MQAFVSIPGGTTIALDVDPSDTTLELQERIELRTGIPAREQRLLTSGRQLREGRTLADYDVTKESRFEMLFRLRGGQPRKVKMMTDHLPCGKQVTIDLEDGFTKSDIKDKLVEATGVPREFQKILLAGVGEIMMGDKRTNIGYGSCGTSTGVLFPENA